MCGFGFGRFWGFQFRAWVQSPQGLQHTRNCAPEGSPSCLMSSAQALVGAAQQPRCAGFGPHAGPSMRSEGSGVGAGEPLTFGHIR